MRVNLDGIEVEILGDPHLGRKFVHGVPLHRRGEREAMVLADFKASLRRAEGARLHVCLGDLFDKAVVDYDTILQAAMAYEFSAHENPDAEFVVLAGNHDLGRDREAVTAFDLFAKLVEGFPNVTVVKGEIHERAWRGGADALFVPWGCVDWIEVAAHPSRYAFFHAETGPVHGDASNSLPLDLLAELGVRRVFTGHVHKPSRFTTDKGVEVVAVGSMQPYAHGEETAEDLYVTLTPGGAVEANEKGWIRNKCVRVLLRPGEVFDAELDCLQLTVKRLGEDEAADAPGTVELGAFDLERMLEESLAGLSIKDEVKRMVGR